MGGIALIGFRFIAICTIGSLFAANVSEAVISPRALRDAGLMTSWGVARTKSRLNGPRIERKLQLHFMTNSAERLWNNLLKRCEWLQDHLNLEIYQREHRDLCGHIEEYKTYLAAHSEQSKLFSDLKSAHYLDASEQYEAKRRIRGSLDVVRSQLEMLIVSFARKNEELQFMVDASIAAFAVLDETERNKLLRAFDSVQRYAWKNPRGEESGEVRSAGNTHLKTDLGTLLIYDDAYREILMQMTQSFGRSEPCAEALKSALGPITTALKLHLNKLGPAKMEHRDGKIQ